MPVHRRWSPEQKRTIIAEYEEAPFGTKGAVLRRYGIQSERVREWRASRDAGLLEVGGVPHQIVATPRAESAELTRLRRENARLEQDLIRAREETANRQTALDTLGKATALLHELVSRTSAEDASPTEPPMPTRQPPSTR